MIFSEQEYQARRLSYNPGAESIPHDSLRFGPTELGGALGAILHATDDWAYVGNIEGQEWSVPDVQTEEEGKVEELVRPKEVEGGRAAFVRGRRMCDSGALQDSYERASREMEEHGPSYMQQQVNLARSIVTRVGGIKPKRDNGVITWGRRIPLGDCDVQEITIGSLHFRGIDYGDTIRLSEKSRITLQNVEAKEKNPCVLLHLVAGAQWLREGRKMERPPFRER